MRRHPDAVAWSAVASAVIALGLTAAGWRAGDWSIDLPWAPTIGLRLEFRFDGLAALYAFLAAGIGLLVFLYSTGYMPRHLDHQGRPATDARRFWAWMTLFMGSMVGLAASQDLILMFLFFDLTADGTAERAA